MKKATRKSLSILLAAVMTLSALLAVPVFKLTAGAAPDGSTLVGRFFSTSNVWYDAVTNNGGGLQSAGGTEPRYDASLGMTYVRDNYLRIANENLLSGVTRDTGLTVAFNYRPNFTGDHRHIFSAGQNAYGNGTANQFFISGATSWYSGGNFPVVAWVNGSDSEVIKAYPSGFSPEQGREYNIVVSVDKEAGVVFYIDGVKKTTAYKDSDLNGQIGNVRSFLDAARNYKQNYIGCSRWTADAKVEGYLSDFRVYKSSITQDLQAYQLTADMAGSIFDFNKPTFNATAYHYSDPANGAFANLVYASPATTENSGMGIRGADNSEDFKDIYAVYLKFFTPLSIVMVYDGVHETYAPIELETKRHDKLNVRDQRIYYVVSNSDLLKTRHNWYGYLESAWKTWAGNYNHTQINTDTSLDVYVGSTNDTSRFWWNAIKYTGTGNTNTYFDHEQNISFTIQAFYDLTVGGTDKGTGTITTLSDYSVLNYKPIYNILDAAGAKYNDEMSGKAWMYTEDSYAKALLAMRRVTLCNPNRYDYAARGAFGGATLCAAAIKQAVADYNAINLVKKTGMLDVNLFVNGEKKWDSSNYVTFDVYVNGNRVSDDVSDYYVSNDYGSEYEVTDISPTTGMHFAGVDGSYAQETGMIANDLTEVWLHIDTNQYKVRFNKNADNATESMGEQDFAYGEEKGLEPNAYKRDGYTFDGWATSADGSKVYSNGQTVSNLTETHNNTVDLYAKWKLNDITVFTQDSRPQPIDCMAGSVTDVEGDRFDVNDDGQIVYTAGNSLTAAETTGFYVGADRATVTVIPSAVIYYDDSASFFTYKIGTEKQAWPATDTVTDAQLSAVTFGDDFSGGQYYGGSAKQITVSSADKLQSGEAIYDNCPTVSFTFTGTAFEVISAVDSQAATVSYAITGPLGENGQTATKRSVVDTYMGYTLNKEGKWVTGGATGTKYRVPVIRVDNLTYGEYTVTVAAFWNEYYFRSHASSNPDDSSLFRFIFDGVRIYDPANAVKAPTDGDNITNRAAIYSAYSASDVDQADWTEMTLRQAIKDAGLLGTAATLVIDGVKIDGSDLTANYINACPKNEIWLSNTDAEGTAASDGLTIKLSEGVTKAWLSVACVNGGTGMTINGGSEITVGYGTQYIDLGADGQEKMITIKCTGEGVLSLRNIRFKGGAVSAVPTTQQARISLFMRAHAADEEFHVLAPFTDEELAAHLDALENPAPAVEPTTTEQPTAPAEPVTQPNSDGVICGYCGKSHPRTFLGSLIRLIHAVLYFFRTVFGLAK